MIGDLAMLLVALACWVGFAYKLRHLRQRSTEPGAPALRALVVVIGLLALAMTLDPAPIASGIDSLVGLPGTARLIENVISMGACLAVMAWLLYVSRGQEEARARVVRQRRVLIAVVVAILVLFALDHPVAQPGEQFAGVYTYVYLPYVIYMVLPVALLSWRFAAVTDVPIMRFGLRMAATGCLFSMIGLPIILIYLVDGHLALGLPGSPVLGRPLYSAGATTFVIGITLPAWGRWIGLEALCWRLTREQATRRLRRLWRIVTQAYPGVVLDRELLAASPHGKRLMAERLPVEIHDGWLQLRHYLNADDVALIDRLAEHSAPSGRNQQAALAAARLAVALRRKRDVTGPMPETNPPVGRLGSSAHATLIADVRFLCAVSRQLESRFVRHVLPVVDDEFLIRPVQQR